MTPPTNGRGRPPHQGPATNTNDAPSAKRSDVVQSLNDPDDTATAARYETLRLPHGLVAVLELRDPRDAAVDRYARELIDEGWDPDEARAVARQHDADQRAVAS